MKSSIFLFYFLITATNLCIGQSIKGIVLDAQSSKGVPNCSVHILHKSVGVISNEKGHFELHEINLQDTLSISSIGYHSWMGCIQDILVKRQDSFFLDHESITLPELVVGNYSAEKLLKICLQKSNAALMKHIVLNTYYREYLKLNDTIKKFSDGMVNFFIGDISNEITVQVKSSRSVDVLSRNARNIMKKFYDALPMEYVIRSYFPKNITPRLDTEKFDHYRYEYIKPKEDNNFFCINITPKPGKNQGIGTVTVFIDKTDTLLSEVRISLLPGKSNTVIARTLNDAVRVEKASVVVTFRELNHKLYLIHYRSDLSNGHHTKIPGINWSEETVTELMANNVQSDNLRLIPESESYKNEFLYQNGNYYKTEFWRTENIISGTQEENSFLSRINK